MRRNKKKIFAMLIFLLMSLIMFASANPSGDVEGIQLGKPSLDVDGQFSIEVFDEIPEFKAVAKDANGNELKVDITHSINNQVLGTYEVRFKAEDLDGNVMEEKRDFLVVDTTRPIISLRGRALVKRILGYERYTDERADVRDNYSPAFVISGVQAGNSTRVGNYYLLYNATDGAGNRALQVTRTIKMLDPRGDEDGDGYSNLEEFNENTDYDNENEYPDYDKAPTITLDEANVYEMLVYDAIPTFKATAYDVGDGVVPVTITHNIKSNISGSYTVTFRAVDSLGNAKVLTREFTVLKRRLQVTIDDKTSVYGSPLEELTYTITSGVEVVPSAGISLNKEAGLDAGTYAITGSYSNKEYEVNFVEGTYTITKKNIEESDLPSTFKFEDGEFVYNKEEHKIVVEGLPADLNVTYDDNTRTDVGSQVVTATITGANYEGSLTKTANLKVTPAQVTYTIDNKTSVYKATLEALTGNITSGSVIASDDLGINLSTEATPTSNVGNYDITGTFTNTNYNVTFVDGKYTITTKTIDAADVADIVFADKTVTYDGNEHKVEVASLPEGFSVSYTNNTRTNHGSQTATATITGNGNYTGTVDKTATLKINKATYDMSGVKFNDKTVTYNGNQHEITITGSLPSGVTVSYTNNQHTNAGTYAATATFTSNNDNYNPIPAMNANLIINKADPDVSPVTGLTAVKGDMLYSVTLPAGYTYKNADSALTTVDNNVVPVIFTPTDTANYNTVETTATIYVKDIFTVTFKSDGVTLKTETVIEGNNATAPADPTKIGHTFDGWDKEYINVQSNLDVNAKWKVNEYTITFNSNGGSTVSPITQNYGTAITAPANPTRTGHTFAGWDQVIPATMPANNMTINATWTINQYTLTFNTDGGNTIPAITQNYGTTITAPANPTKTNYKFVRWEPAIPATMPAKNLTVKAIWEANQIGIVVKEKANAQLVFTEGQPYNIKQFIDVFPKYADGTEGSTPINPDDYTTNFNNATPGNKTLTVTQTSTSFTGTIPYRVKADTAYQTKFEAIHNPSAGGYNITKRYHGYYYCTGSCNTGNNIEWIPTTDKILEVIEHYEQIINVQSVRVKYKNEASFGSPLDKIPNGQYDHIRYSKKQSGSYWDPVYAYRVDDNKEIDLVKIRYHRANHGTFEITFVYENAGNLRAISEQKI